MIVRGNKYLHLHCLLHVAAALSSIAVVVGVC